VKRWVWNISCALSLLIFTTSVTLWVRSYWRYDYIAWTGEPAPRSSKVWGIACSFGAVVFYHSYHQGATYDPGTKGLLTMHSREPETLQLPRQKDDHWNLAVAGFQTVYGVSPHRTGSDSYHHLMIPLWLFLPAGIPPFLWWRKRSTSGGRGFPVGVTSASEESIDREVREDAKTTAKG